MSKWTTATTSLRFATLNGHAFAGCVERIRELSRRIHLFTWVDICGGPRKVGQRRLVDVDTPFVELLVIAGPEPYLTRPPSELWLEMSKMPDSEPWTFSDCDRHPRGATLELVAQLVDLSREVVLLAVITLEKRGDHEGIGEELALEPLFIHDGVELVRIDRRCALEGEHHPV